MRLSLACTVAAALSVLLGGTTEAQAPLNDLIAPAGAAPPFTCATQPDVAVSAARRFRKLDILPDGGVLRYTQEPTLLSADYTGAVTLRELLVVGDVPAVQFKPAASDAVETWTRDAVVSVGGRPVSVFNPTWPGSRLSEIMRAYEVGFDEPLVYWGEVQLPGHPDGDGYPVTLRMTSNGLPNVTIRRLADDVQYSSSVVNIRADGFGDNRVVDDEFAFNVPAVTRKFYQYFEDSYDTIALVTQDGVTSNSATAFHVNVRNDVRGIGAELFDDSARYGSAGRLYGYEMFFHSSIASDEVSAHEAAHQWGDFIDWTRLTGLSRAGHQADVHDPLMTGGETLIGAVLFGTRRVRSTGAGWDIEKTPPPIRFHPTTLYAMGVLPREALPELTLFDQQDQFDASAAASPAAGTPVAGTTRTTTGASIVGMLGPRGGPVASTVQRAIVVVSNGRLLTQREMNYWTFFAQRVADPNHSGVGSIDGYVSFDAATGNMVDMRHEIRPRNGAAIVEPLPVDYPQFAASDFRGVTLDAPVPSLIGVGAQLRVSGRVTADDRSDFFGITFVLRPVAGTPGSIIRGDGAVTASGGFVVNMPVVQAEQAGRYELEIYLFFPGAGGQSPRSVQGPITIG